MCCLSSSNRKKEISCCRLALPVGKSPRRLERFVNTDRILKASLDKLQQETFVLKAGSQVEYRAAVALLAMVEGAPKSSLGMLEFLANSVESNDITAFENYLKDSADSAEQKHAQAALATYRRAEIRADIEVLRRWAPASRKVQFPIWSCLVASRRFRHPSRVREPLLEILDFRFRSRQLEGFCER